MENRLREKLLQDLQKKEKEEKKLRNQRISLLNK
jgi:hypothetical protein